MLVRTTRFLLLMLIASACLLTLSGRALAASQTENDANNTDSTTPAVSSVSQHGLETTVQTSQQSTVESTSVSNIVTQDGAVSYTADRGTTQASVSPGAKSASVQATSESTAGGDTLASSHQLNVGAATRPSQTNTYPAYSQYYQDSSSYSAGLDGTEAMPTTLQSQASNGANPVPTNLPLDSTSLMLRMIATVFQAGQFVTIATSVTVLGTIALFSVADGVPLTTALLVLGVLTLTLVSLLLRSWRKNGFSNAARSDVDGLGMIFAVTKRGFAYHVASSFFVTTNIQIKQLIT